MNPEAETDTATATSGPATKLDGKVAGIPTEVCPAGRTTVCGTCRELWSLLVTLIVKFVVKVPLIPTVALLITPAPSINWPGMKRMRFVEGEPDTVTRPLVEDAGPADAVTITTLFPRISGAFGEERLKLTFVCPAGIITNGGVAKTFASLEYNAA